MTTITNEIQANIVDGMVSAERERLALLESWYELVKGAFLRAALARGKVRADRKDSLSGLREALRVSYENEAEGQAADEALYAQAPSLEEHAEYRRLSELYPGTRNTYSRLHKGEPSFQHHAAVLAGLRSHHEAFTAAQQAELEARLAEERAASEPEPEAEIVAPVEELTPAPETEPEAAPEPSP